MQLENIGRLLAENSYPGRGIILGRSACGKHGVIAYFIMGRSQNSRNRIFEATDDGIRTRAFDESQMTDPSLIIYHPVRMLGGTAIVTNGDQTDTIRDALLGGRGYIDALRTRCFEPDPPLYTPRVSGLLDFKTGGYCLSILKSADGDPACNHRYFFEYDTPLAGQGHFIHTYQQDGAPPPSFEGEPRRISLDAPDAEALADVLWASLNEGNKVALYTCYIDLPAGHARWAIRNKHQ